MLVVAVAITFYNRYYAFEVEVALVQFKLPLLTIPFVQLLLGASPILFASTFSVHDKKSWVFGVLSFIVLSLFLLRVYTGYEINDWLIGNVFALYGIFNLTIYVLNLIQKARKLKKWHAAFSLAVFAISLGFTFYRFPIYQPDIMPMEGKTYGKLLENESFPSNTLLDNGLVFFISSGCEYCYSLYNKTVAWSEMDDIPHVYYLQGSEESNDYFFERSLKKVDNIYPLGDSSFFEYCGPSLPSIIQLENGQVINYWSGDNFGFPNLLELRKQYSE